MDIILVAGFNLGACAWADVVPPLEAAGHTVHALTLPGLTPDADRSAVHLEDHVEAVVEAIDAVPAERRVVLVGHSGGGGVVYAASGRRPDRVARVVYVDSGPMGDGQAVMGDLDPGLVELDLPPWEQREDQDLVGLTPELRERFRALAVPHPAGPAREPYAHPGDAVRRRAVPSTVISCTYPAAVVRDLMAQGHPFFAEAAELTDLEIVDLPTGHWPMFSEPAALAAAIAAASA